MYIGTADGLNIMDGSTITTCKSSADRHSISSNVINAIAEDKEGRLWIATAAGLSSFDPVRKSFDRYSFPEVAYGDAGNILSMVLQGNTIACGTDGGGLFTLALDTKKVTSFVNASEVPRQRFFTNKIHKIIAEGNILYLCTSAGFWSFDKANNTFKKLIEGRADPGYYSLFLDAADDGEGNIWLTGWNNGLKKYNKQSQTVTDFSGLPGCLPNTTTLCFIKKQDGGKLIFLNNKLPVFDPAAEKFSQLGMPLQMQAYPEVDNAYVANDGWLWMPSNSGLYVYNPGIPFRNTIFTTAATTQSVSFAWFKGKMLVGAEDRNALTLNNNDGSIAANYSALLAKTCPARSQISLLGIVSRDDKNIWLTSTQGITKLNPDAGTARWFTAKAHDSTSLPRNFVSNIFFDSDNTCWVFPWREGIWTMDTAAGKCRKMIAGLSNTEGFTKKLVIADAAEDEKGNVWFADLDEGLIFYNKATKQFSKPFAKQQGNFAHAARICKKNGWLYAAVNNYIAEWKDESSFIKISFPPEMDKGVYDFVQDRNKNWWFATHSGLVFWNEEKNIFHRYSTTDGLYENDMNGTLYCTPVGEVFFGAAFYTLHFAPDALSAAAETGKVILTGFSANEEQLLLPASGAFLLPYNRNNISIRWALPDFANPFRNRYYYLLQGIDSTYRDAGNTGLVQYANLSPGKYTVLLKAANANGTAAGNVVRLSFVIRPPFWKAAWFISLCLLLAAIIIYLLVRKRIRQIKAKAFVKQQMTELELKALRAQMNPHFIFNSLSSIQDSILSNKTDAAAKYLGKFSKLIRMVLENSGRKFITLREEADYLQLYLELESFRFDDFTFEIKYADNIDADFMRLPPMIIQPYIENAVRHGLAHREGGKKLTVNFYLDGNALMAVVEDNGIGRSRSAEINSSRPGSHRSMGMDLTTERLALFNDAAADQVAVTDLYDEQGTSTGTRITIKLPAEQ